jgi:hypothetical protein
MDMYVYLYMYIYVPESLQRESISEPISAVTSLFVSTIHIRSKLGSNASSPRGISKFLDAY